MDWPTPAFSAVVVVVYTAVSGEPPFSVPVPRSVDPSMNDTVPAGVPPVPVTVAVKVTEFPYVDVGNDETTLAVVVPITD